MVKVRVEAIIREGYGSSPKDGLAVRNLTCPFTPTVGINFVDGGWESGDIKTVHAELQDREWTVVCRVASDRRRRHQVYGYGKTPESVEDILREYMENGWERGSWERK